mmetsp:Transcript_4138/g.12443  ORF Transcript_4138/g.12443 Transcript_4138/m.12443 type:complete len:143 (-) Transcript_4138:260-688(-)
MSFYCQRYVNEKGLVSESFFYMVMRLHLVAPTHFNLVKQSALPNNHGFQAADPPRALEKLWGTTVCFEQRPRHPGSAISSQPMRRRPVKEQDKKVQDLTHTRCLFRRCTRTSRIFATLPCQDVNKRICAGQKELQALHELRA